MSTPLQEAFALWLSQWQSLYDESSAAPDAQARRVIQEIHDSWWLVSIVDNEYVDSAADVFSVFRDVVLESLSPEGLRARVSELEAEAAALREEQARLRSDYARTAAELEAAAEAARREGTENARLRQQLLALRGKQPHVLEGAPKRW